MAISPETLDSIGQIASIIFASGLAAYGGYRIKGARIKAPETPAETAAPLPAPHAFCADHSLMQEVRKDLKELAEKFDERWESLSSEVFGILRTHERELGELRGSIRRIDSDTKKVGVR